MSPVLKIIRHRRGAPWSEDDDRRLMEIGNLAPKTIADTMGRTWPACYKRLLYLRAAGRPDQLTTRPD